MNQLRYPAKAGGENDESLGQVQKHIKNKIDAFDGEVTGQNLVNFLASEEVFGMLTKSGVELVNPDYNADTPKTKQFITSDLKKHPDFMKAILSSKKSGGKTMKKRRNLNKGGKTIRKMLKRTLKRGGSFMKKLTKRK